jgi:hypothetical protein
MRVLTSGFYGGKGNCGLRTELRFGAGGGESTFLKRKRKGGGRVVLGLLFKVTLEMI